MARVVKSKKLINSVEGCVDDYLAGLVAVNPGLRQLRGHRVILRAEIEQYKKSGKVVILTGGGSGHEPALVGYVGVGMASAAVVGTVFASPSVKPILAALRALGKNHPAGVIVIFNNYTGDRLNFGCAIERARLEGIRVNYILNWDDCTEMAENKRTGPRGLAGFVVLNKIAGSLAEEGKSYEEVMRLTQEARDNIGTLGVCLAPCSVPGGGPLFQIDPDRMEIGLGLHGEAGVRSVPLMTAHDTVVTMMDCMTEPGNPRHIAIKPGDRVAILVNNLGSTTDLEVYTVCGEAIQYLERRGVVVERAYANRFVTSQEMAGLSISILHLDDTRRRCLDQETNALAWRAPLLPDQPISRLTSEAELMDLNTESDLSQSQLRGVQISPDQADLVYRALKCISETLISAEEELNRLDAGAGDGDCGSTFRAGAQAILKKLGQVDCPGLPLTYPHDLLLELANIAEETMGGTSGALYCQLLTSAAGPLLKDTSVGAWVLALRSSCDAVTKYGGAEPGDRTMLDPLHDACRILEDNVDRLEPSKAFLLAVRAAEESAEATASMTAQVGRASYVSADRLSQPDPGARCVALWMSTLYQTIYPH